MADRETLTWTSKAHGFGFMTGCGCFPFVAILCMILSVVTPLEGTWLIVVLALLIVTGAVVGIVAERTEVHTAEFTRRQVRLVSRTVTRTVDVADLTSLTVEHSGDVDQGYDETTLGVTWPDGTEKIDGVHDPALASSLTELLGPGVAVREKWKELDRSLGTA
ncbi:hypothetical protein GCM10023194_52230 [Planotetraspora phitsanulokensis]|uniref:PH domain-containing protein n=1 Tax=Planotetraspora phitsanulokensis TaxID=575192 RepID=A0A8J3UJ74_9ACTN|nr:hypothetical protein [Planotetraspora phitsanulokensis]GII39795.1 hypothetical protein Pph01_47980 [Planotetraspora phitsanulokensis]